MKISIHSDLKAFVLTSSLKREDLLLLKQYKPNALKVKNADGDDLFAIGTEGNSISNCGASFGKANQEGYAIITGNVEAAPGQEPGEWVADKVGQALEYINALEASLPAEAAKIKADRAALIGSITVC